MCLTINILSFIVTHVIKNLSKRGDVVTRERIIVVRRERLIQEREKRSKTRALVAEKLGISVIYLRMLERGSANPGRDVMFRFAEYYGLSIKTLFPDLFTPKSDKKLIEKDDSA